MFDTLPSSSNSSLQVVRDQQLLSAPVCSVSRRIRNGDAQQGLTLLLTVSILQLGRSATHAVCCTSRSVTPYSYTSCSFRCAESFHILVIHTLCRLCDALSFVRGGVLVVLSLSVLSLYRPKRRLARGSSPASRSRLSVSQWSHACMAYTGVCAHDVNENV